MFVETEKSTVMQLPHEYEPPRSLRTWLLGRPLSTADAPHQTIGKRVGLAVFASDALSSTAYATQEILVILSAAGAAAFSLAFPISIAIVVLLAIVTISYEQTIHAYPGGGGAPPSPSACCGGNASSRRTPPCSIVTASLRTSTSLAPLDTSWFSR